MKIENIGKKLSGEKYSMRIPYFIRKQVNIVKHGCDDFFSCPHPKLVHIFLISSS